MLIVDIFQGVYSVENEADSNETSQVSLGRGIGHPSLTWGTKEL